MHLHLKTKYFILDLDPASGYLDPLEGNRIQVVIHGNYARHMNGENYAGVLIDAITDDRDLLSKEILVAVVPALMEQYPALVDHWRKVLDNTHKMRVDICFPSTHADMQVFAYRNKHLLDHVSPFIRSSLLN